jgi:hypothetical protein
MATSTSVPAWDTVALAKQLLMTIGRDRLCKAETVTVAAIESGVELLVEAREVVADFGGDGGCEAETAQDLGELAFARHRIVGRRRSTASTSFCGHWGRRGEGASAGASRVPATFASDKALSGGRSHRHGADRARCGDTRCGRRGLHRDVSSSTGVDDDTSRSKPAHCR